MTDYVYPITSIPGGIITLDNKACLAYKIRAAIATPLLGVFTDETNLTISFEADLTPQEKIILDNNTDPPEGLVIDTTDFIEVTVNDTIIDNFNVSLLPGDGASNLLVILTRKNGDGIILTDVYPHQIHITSPGGIAPINHSTGEFNSITGKFEFRILPTASRFRGQRSIIVDCAGLPSRCFVVRLT